MDSVIGEDEFDAKFHLYKGDAYVVKRTAFKVVMMVYYWVLLWGGGMGFFYGSSLDPSGERYDEVMEGVGDSYVDIVWALFLDTYWLAALAGVVVLLIFCKHVFEVLERRIGFIGLTFVVDILSPIDKRLLWRRTYNADAIMRFTEVTKSSGRLVRSTQKFLGVEFLSSKVMKIYGAPEDDIPVLKASLRDHLNCLT